MNCTEFETRVNEQIDHGSFVETPALTEHLAECAACRAWWESAQTLADAIAAWRDEAFDIDLRSVVVSRHFREVAAATVSAAAPLHAAMSAESAGQSPRQNPASGRAIVSPSPASRSETPITAGGDASARTRWTLVASLAAMTLLLAFSAVPSFDKPEPIVARRTSATTSVVRPAKHADSLPQPEMAPSTPDDSPYVALGKQATGVLAGLFVPGGSEPGPMPGPSIDRAAAASWLDGLQSQWQPVGESLGNALDFIWQAGDAHDSVRT